MASIKSLVGNIVDYAGLFPPAKLPLSNVVENYSTYLESDFAWMLARLIIPAARLNEFADVAKDVLPKSGQDQPWLISALVPSPSAPDAAMEGALKLIDEFNRKHSQPANGLAHVDTIEIKAPNTADIQAVADAVPGHINAFLEFPHDEDPQELIQQIAGAGNLFAKIRTGGVTQQLIPPAEQVSRFIYRCSEAGVGMKATAGLHHPLRGEYRLTYDPDADHGTMFGYLNVFLATCFAIGAGASEPHLTEILNETDINKFRFEHASIEWSDLSVDIETIEAIRKTKAVSFGSCSFDEPTQELAQLHSLAAS